MLSACTARVRGPLLPSSFLCRNNYWEIIIFNKTYSCRFSSVQKEKLFKILHSCICSLGEALLDAEMINALLRILFASSTDCSYRILLTKSLSIEVPYHSRKSLLTSPPQAVERGYKDAVLPKWTKWLALHPTALASRLAPTQFRNSTPGAEIVVIQVPSGPWRVEHTEMCRIWVFQRLMHP